MNDHDEINWRRNERDDETQHTPIQNTRLFLYFLFFRVKGKVLWLAPARAVHYGPIMHDKDILLLDWWMSFAGQSSVSTFLSSELLVGWRTCMYLVQQSQMQALNFLPYDFRAMSPQSSSWASIEGGFVFLLMGLPIWNVNGLLPSFHTSLVLLPTTKHFLHPSICYSFSMVELLLLSWSVHVFERKYDS